MYGNVQELMKYEPGEDFFLEVALGQSLRPECELWQTAESEPWQSSAGTKRIFEAAQRQQKSLSPYRQPLA